MSTRLLSLLLASVVVVASARGAAAQWGRDYLPNVPVVTQDGKTLKFYDDVIKDKISVISFIFTTCRDICPLVTARMAQVYDRLGDAAGREIQFISITIDPEIDTPALMKKHADAFHAGPGWLFLTGKPADIHLIRHKLGERSKEKTAHRNDVLLANGRTGEWARDSAFADTSSLAHTIRDMDPAYRARPQSAPVANGARVVAMADLVPGQGLFAKACSACHTIGRGEKVGPDLRDITKRRDRAWVARYMMTPGRIQASDDPIARELGVKYKVRMPNLGVEDADAADLISYIELQSHKLDKPTTRSAAHEASHRNDAKAKSGGKPGQHH